MVDYRGSGGAKRNWEFKCVLLLQYLQAEKSDTVKGNIRALRFIFGQYRGDSKVRVEVGK